MMTPDKLIPLSRLSKAEEHRDQVLFAQLIGEIRRTQREDIELLVLEELILRILISSLKVIGLLYVHMMTSLAILVQILCRRL